MPTYTNVIMCPLFLLERKYDTGEFLPEYADYRIVIVVIENIHL